MDPITALAASPATPAPPPAEIRPFVSSSDLKVTRFLVGSSVLEPSALANLAALWSPVALVLWAVLAHLLVLRFTPGWPSSAKLILSGQGALWWSTWSSSDWLTGVIQWLTIIPVLVAPPIILLASFELRHRTMFEEEMARAIGDEDMTEVDEFYSTTALTKKAKKATTASDGGRRGFWVLEYDSRIIAAFGIDGRKAGKTLESVSDRTPVVVDDKKSGAKASTPTDDDSTSTATTTGTPSSPYPLRNRTAPTTPTPVSKKAISAPSSTSSSSTPLSDSSTVHLRRFATSLSFRSVDIEDDLLAYAANFAFAPSPPGNPSQPPATKLVYALRPSIQKELLKRVLKAGFRELPKGAEGEIEYEAWRKNVKVGPVAKVVNALWPLDLGWRTYVLEKKVWEQMKKN